MAAGYVRALRSSVKGLHLDPGRWLLTRSSQTPALLCQCARPQAARGRLLHVSPVASLSSSSRTEPQKSSPAEGRRAREEEEEEEEEEEGPEDIPNRKPKNPMIKIGYAWMIGLPTGIISFILAKREVDKNRLKQLKVRQRMKMSNEGEYEGSRHQRHSERVHMDQ